MTAAITNRMIESVCRNGRGEVDLLESQGDQWITVEQDISRRRAGRAGFNLDAPAVRRVFDEAESLNE